MIFKQIAHPSWNRVLPLAPMDNTRQFLLSHGQNFQGPTSLMHQLRCATGSPNWAPVHQNGLLQFSGQPVDTVIRAGHDALLHNAHLDVGEICLARIGRPILGTATLISPKHVLIARHILNGHRLSELNFIKNGSGYPIKLVEDGAERRLDYAILEIQNGSFATFVRLNAMQPPLSTYTVGFDSEKNLTVFAEEKPYEPFEQLLEVNYLPTQNGMSGMVYRDAETGTGFAVHIKRWFSGMFDGQSTGVLVSELLGIASTESSLNKIIQGNFRVPIVECDQPFAHFSTANANEIDQGVTDIRNRFIDSLSKHKFFTTNHLKIGPCNTSYPPNVEPDLIAHNLRYSNENLAPSPLIIEVMEQNIDSAKSKIQALLTSGRTKRNFVTLIVALNAPVTTISTGPNQCNTFKKMTQQSTDLAQFMSNNGVYGCCFPMVWIPTKLNQKSYVFPFMESRSILSLHPGIEGVHRIIRRQSVLPVVRWMDADVSRDPLLLPIETEEDTMRETILQAELQKISLNGRIVLSGGYLWDPATAKNRLQQLKERFTDDELDDVITTLNCINEHEFRVRTALLDINGVKSIYWPEPNLYASFDARLEGAVNAFKSAESKPNGTQQKESTYLIGTNIVDEGVFMRILATTKPIKEEYADTFLRTMLKMIKSRKLDRDSIATAIKTIRQTHMNAGNVSKILTWNGRPEIIDINELCERHLTECADDILQQIIFATDRQDRGRQKTRAPHDHALDDRS